MRRQLAIAIVLVCAGGCPKSRAPVEEPLGGGSGVSSTISVGVEHACLIDDDGAARCWGTNESSQVGLFGDDDRWGCFDAPTLVPGASGFTQIASGEFATCGLG